MLRTFITPALLLVTALSVAAQEPAPVSTAAENAITEANQLIAAKPQEAAGYNFLAAALLNRAEETSDPALYAKAQVAVEHAFQIAPQNFETAKLEVAILLAEHQDAAALDQATALNKKVPDDVAVYGLLTDANIALGRYKDAETSAQWMLRMLPGNRPAFLRAAQLRELFGELSGSLELLGLALQSTTPGEISLRASILSRMAHVLLLQNKLEDAAQRAQSALTLLPSDPAALETLAAIRMEQKQSSEAIALLQKRTATFPSVHATYKLAEALDQAGKTVEAKAAYAEFLKQSQAETQWSSAPHRDAVFYYADHSHDPAAALALAEKDFQHRKDVYTLDAYAWALFRSGHQAEARTQIESALAVGVQDPELLAHAKEIDSIQTANSARASN